MWGAVGAAQGVARRLVLIPVEYGDMHEGGPQVANYIEDVATGLSRNYSGEIVAKDRLFEAIDGAWVMRRDEAALASLESEAKAAIELFYQEGGGAAIPKLERLVREADALLPAVSADPARAELLLKAHLFLWWSFRQVGEEAQLSALMAQTAERFPAATVSSIDMPPYVAQAFNQAREDQRASGVAVSVYLDARERRDCRIFIDGFAHGDGRSAGIVVRPGRTYYVMGQCGESRLPARRVVANRSVELALDMVLADHLVQRGSWTALRADMGAEAIGTLTDLAVAGGTALQASQVVLASVTMQDGEPVLQLDRVSMERRQRVCSVRMPLGPNVAPGDVDAAVRAVIVGKPTPTTILFASDDNVYRTPDEYIEFVTDEGIHRIFTWVTAGIVLGTAVSAGALELAAVSDQNNLKNCIRDLSCRGTREAEDLRVDLNDTLVTRDVLYLTSGVLALTSIVLYFVEAPDPDDYLASPGLHIAPWLGADVAGAGALWRY